MGKDKRLIVDGKIAGTLTESSMGGGELYFGVTVSPLRAEYLAKCLDEPLCSDCGREEAECEADPCEMKKAKWVNPMLLNRIPVVDHAPVSAEYRGNDYGDDDKPDITVEQASAYLIRRGAGCPVCGDSAIEGGSYDLCDGTIYQTMHCTECPAEWDDAYELDRILDIEIDWSTAELNLKKQVYDSMTTEKEGTI